MSVIISANFQLQEDILGCIPRLITEEVSHTLCASPSIEEVKKVVFDMDGDSMVGQDRFSALFFQKCWDIIHKNLLDVCCDFFQGNPMPKSFKCTSIALIPKVEAPHIWAGHMLV